MTDRILKKPAVRSITGLCDNTLREMESEGSFPRRFVLNPRGRSVGWRESAVMAWIEERANSRVDA